MTKPLTLLCVDDDELLSKAFKRNLEQNKEWEVTLAHTFRAVRNLISKDDVFFDAAIVDLGIGGNRGSTIDDGEEIIKMLVEKGIRVGLWSGQTGIYPEAIASRLGVPFFEKGTRTISRDIVFNILNFNPEGKPHKER
ncbi:hypothetical protein HYT02_01435 [Candidatus Gottesmanbacteria bacterium]|nr:hypothetical protein [Candidatus Gottesmanbacteria bacterium]